MSKRSEHTFQFPAEQIRDAARAEAEYHEARADYWRSELDTATTRVEETASVKVERRPQTGGWRPEVVIDTGDPAAYARMSEASRKLQTHTDESERFRTDERVYGSQVGLLVTGIGKLYDLDADDVHHFRLGGQPRED